MGHPFSVAGRDSQIMIGMQRVAVFLLLLLGPTQIYPPSAETQRPGVV